MPTSRFTAAHRLYGILDINVLAARALAPEDVCVAWLSAGIRLIQLRAKTLQSGAMLELATRLAGMCREAGAIFVVNDRADIARLSSSAGVHVGQEDLSPADARLVVGVDAVIGMSTHGTEQLARALDQPVDYVAVGPVFATASKERPDPVVGLDTVRAVRTIAESSGRMLVAIGGITIERAPLVIEAGASSVAVISDLMAHDPEARARAFLRALA